MTSATPLPPRIDALPRGRRAVALARFGRLGPSYATLERIRLPNGLYLASPSADYSKVWLRDTFYEVLPYVDKPTHHYEQTYWSLLDILRKHEAKIDRVIAEKPTDMMDYIHARFHPETLEEFQDPWGNKQNDAVGALLFGVALGLSHGKRVLRDEKDRQVVQKLVYYLLSLRYWEDPDNGMWEEYEEVHASSVGACLAGLLAVRAHGFDVPETLVSNGRRVLDELLPRESVSKKADLALLSLVYPYRVVSLEQSRAILRNVERELLRERGVIRYRGDSYYSTKEKEHGRAHAWEFYHGSEAEWTMGLPWLSIAWRELGNDEKADYYLLKAKFAQTRPGCLPELYYAGTTKPNPNTPLGWAVALHVIARERAGARIAWRVESAAAAAAPHAPAPRVTT